MTPRQNRVRRIALASLLACAALPAFAIISFSPGNTPEGALASTQITASSIDVPQTKAAAEAVINTQYPQLDALYKDLHAHPELAFAETRTAAKLAAEMRKVGFEVTENVGKTGVVAVFRNGPGPTIMVRTDLDGLPMEEKTGLPYASQVRTKWKGADVGVTHSCGHDIHMASWVGTAKTLVSLKDRWHGTLLFVAQPAEEIVSGAQSMIDDGILKRFPKPNYAFALHTGPGPYGSIVFNSGPITANGNGFEITFKGRGGHGSAPDKTIDPVMMASRFVVDLQSVISREKDPQEFGVVSVGTIQGGSAGNIIPDTVLLRGTIRSYKPEVRQKIFDGLRRTATAVTEMAGAPQAELHINTGTGAVNNDPTVVARTETIFKIAFGNDRVLRVPPMTGSEDFSAFVDAGIPSMYFFVGVYDPAQFAASLKPGGKPLPDNHSPFFAPVPEPSIKTGVLAMSLAVMNAMQWK